MAKTLSREEAEEYTKNLGQVAVGNFGLMEFAMHTLQVPRALDMTNEEWVQDRLGGYIRWSVEQRREAVRELSGERSEGGRYERTSKQVAEILGIGESTVRDDRLHIEETERRDAPKELEAASKKRPGDLAKQIRKRLEDGESTMEIAVALGTSASTVRSVRSELNKEKKAAEQPSDKLKQAKADKKAALDRIPKAERKAQEAKFEEFVQDFKSSFSQATGVYLRPLAQELRLEMQRVMDGDLEMADYEEVVALVLETANELWVYGAKRGHDVSDLAKVIDP